MKRILVISLFALLVFSCKENNVLKPEDQISRIRLDFNGLQNLGPDYWYEGWINWLEKSPSGERQVLKSVGVFTVDDQGVMSQNIFDINLGYLQGAQEFILTVEEDADPGQRYKFTPQGDSTVVDTIYEPSADRILAAAVSGNTGLLSIGHEEVLDFDFAQASGTFLLNTPTDPDNALKTSGIWFIDLDTTGTPVKGLNMPGLPTGWTYEGWVEINGQTLSTGQFKNIQGFDLSNRYSDNKTKGYAFPGEDFLKGAPAGLTFPLDLSGGVVYISLYPPHPEGANRPFTAIPLKAAIPADAVPGKAYPFENMSADFPSGSLSLEIEIYD